MNQMNFREAVKMIHPDVNPDITEAGQKMRTLTMCKNDPVRICSWMKRWGLVGLVDNEKQDPQWKWVAVSTLSASTFYNGMAGIRHKNGKMYRVSKTTKKRAYFTENSGNTKFCNVTSIRGAWIKRKI